MGIFLTSSFFSTVLVNEKSLCSHFTQQEKRTRIYWVFIMGIMLGIFTYTVSVSLCGSERLICLRIDRKQGEKCHLPRSTSFQCPDFFLPKSYFSASENMFLRIKFSYINVILKTENVLQTLVYLNNRKLNYH